MYDYVRPDEVLTALTLLTTIFFEQNLATTKKKKTLV